MIAVDTSVWIEFFRGKNSKIIANLSELIQASEVVLPYPVKIELLGGASKKERFVLKRALSALPLLIPERDDWELVEAWTLQSSERGERFGVFNLLIGALAAKTEAKIWSLDSDFGRMEKMKFIKCLKF